MSTSKFWTSVLYATLALAGSFAGGLVAQHAWPAASALAAQTYPRRVIAQSFIMVDRQGKPLAALETEEGRSGLVFYHTDGRRRAVLGVESHGSGLTLYDQQGKPRLTIAVTTEGAPVLALYDGNGLNRGELHLGRDGAPALVLYDRGGKTRAIMGITSKDSAALALYDKNGQDRSELRIAPDGEPLLSFYGPLGELRLAVGMQAARSGVALYNRGGKLVAGLP